MLEIKDTAVRTRKDLGLRIQKVNSRELEQTFIDVHVNLNRDIPGFIRPLDKDIRAVFDPAVNKTFRHGEAQRWLLFDKSGTARGRIAAFTNSHYKASGDTIPVGGIGFFDCANSQHEAGLLFDVAKRWLAAREMEGMDGPINFGQRDRWWGLLVDGFSEPLYGMNFNPPYYRELFENYGFRNFYDQICWSLPMMGEVKQLHPRFYSEHARYSGNPDFTARWIPKRRASELAEDFCTVYNKAWARHKSNKSISIAQAKSLFRSMKPIIDEKLVWFAYYRNEPIAMWISIPDINQALKDLNGQFGPVQKIQFQINRWRGKIDRMVGIIFGVVPEFQGQGIDYFLIVEAEKVIKRYRGYREVELQWQGDYNPKMLAISRNLGAVERRRLTTYRYLFDRTAPFSRHPELD